MANEKEVAYSIKILGTDREVNTIKQLKDELKSVNDSLSKAQLGSQQYQVLNEQAQGLTSELNKLRKENEITQKEFNSLKFPIGSYRQLQAEVASNTEKLRQSAVGINITAEAYTELEQKVISGKAQLADFDRKLSPSGTLVGEYARGIKQAFEEIGVEGFLNKVSSAAEENTGAIKGSIAAMKNELALLKELQQKYTAEGTEEFDTLGKKINELGGEIRGFVQDQKDAIKINEGLDTTFKSLAGVSGAFISGIGAFQSYIGGAQDASAEMVELAKNIQLVQAVSQVAEAQEQARVLVQIGYQKLLNIEKSLEGAIESKNIVIRYAAIAAQRVLNAVTSAGPYGAIAIALGAVITAYGTYKLLVGTVTDAERKRNLELKVRSDFERKAAADSADQIATLTKLRIALTDVNVPLQSRKKILSEYNQVADENNKLSATDLGNIEKINKAIDAQIELIVKRTKVSAATSLLSDAMKEQFEAIDEQSKIFRKAEEENSKISLNILKDAYESAQVLSSLMSGDNVRANLIDMYGVEYADAVQKRIDADNKVIATQKLLKEAIEQARGTDATNTETKTNTSNANIDSEIEAQQKAGQIYLELVKKQVEERLKAVKDGRAKEIQEEKNSLNNLRSEIIKQLDEQDKLLDENRKKRAEIIKDTKLPEAERNKAVKRLDEEYAGILNERNQSGKLANEILIQAEENMRARIAAINAKYDDEEHQSLVKQLEDNLQIIDDGTKSKLLLTEEGRLKEELGLDEHSSKKLEIDRKFEAEDYKIKKQGLLDKLKLIQAELDAEKQRLFFLVNKPTASSDGTPGPVAQETPAVKAKRAEVAKLLQMQQELNTALAQLDAEHTNNVKTQSEIRVNTLTEEQQKQADQVSTYLGVISNAASGIQSALQELGQRESEKFDEQIEARKDKISDLENKVETSTGRMKKIYEAQLKSEQDALKKSEAEKEQVRLKYARAAKAVAVIQAIIATAMSVLQALSSVPPPASYVMAAVSGALGAVQIGLIASQKLAKGGNLDGDVSGNGIPSGAGMINGPSHAGGGVKFIYKGQRYEAEGGELKTHNGNSRYIFTKKVADDPVLKQIALATHNNTGHPMARMVGSMVNMYAGGRSFGGTHSGWLAAGGDLDSVAGVPLNAPMVVTQTTDPAIIQLISDVNTHVASVKDYVDATNSRLDNLKVAVPVDQVTDVQTKTSEVKTAALF